MSWKETCAVKERAKFIFAHEADLFTFSDLCKNFNISRKTGYKWLTRYKKAGILALENKSSAPHNHPNRTRPEIEEAILEVKRAYKHWGPKKIIHWLTQEHRDIAWPSASTAGDLLKRYGLTEKRRKRVQVPRYTQPFALCTAPNDVWSIDYKGDFKLGNGQRCYPLTLTDNYSRYLLGCDAFPKISGLDVKNTMIRLFKKYGLPKAIKSDNGSPFSSKALGGLSQLSVWWIKLGITPERIRPGHPEENGRHERMHLTMKTQIARPPQATMSLQQKALDQFQIEFNNERPHEGIDNQRPAWLYTSSSREYPDKLKSVEYDSNVITRQIRTNGTMKWAGKEIFISEVLSGERIGLTPVNDFEWLIQFSSFNLAIFNEKTLAISNINV